MQAQPSCPLCAEAAAEAACLWRSRELRVVDAGAPGLPGYTRVVWNAHVAEMTQLDAPARQRLMQAVWAVEQALRDTLDPVKINLAEFGNQVPHLHWHVIPRWTGDMYFPDAIWAAPAGDAGRQAAWRDAGRRLMDRVPAYHAALRHALDAM